MQPHLSSELHVATLCEIIIKGQPTIYAQNWCPEPYAYCGKLYEYCAFSAQGISRQLDTGSGGQKITIENAGAFDALMPIRELLRTADGWRQGKLRIITIFPDYPDQQPIVVRSQILNSRISGPPIEIAARSPIEAINARIPSSWLSNQTIPELPR